MDVSGIDFTSAPGRRKPITCLHCRLEDNVLRAGDLEEWTDFEAFEQALRRPGPWIAGLDFPFGQARRFIETIGWPQNWHGYVGHARSLGRRGFREALETYRRARAAGNKEHRRETDRLAGSISPQKLYGVPVALMFFEGAPRLASSGVTIPHLQEGDPERIVVEAYPGVLARQITRQPYKNDSKARQTTDQHSARREILAALCNGHAQEHYGLDVEAPEALCDDPGGDHLDALLCAVQAGWAWIHRERGFGTPLSPDRLEGWIADPSLHPERQE